MTGFHWGWIGFTLENLQRLVPTQQMLWLKTAVRSADNLRIIENHISKIHDEPHNGGKIKRIGFIKKLDQSPRLTSSIGSTLYVTGKGWKLEGRLGKKAQAVSVMFHEGKPFSSNSVHLIFFGHLHIPQQKPTPTEFTTV